MKTQSSRIALGTVQFGLKYGISNTRGQVPHTEVPEILGLAFRNRIDTLDTSHAYGTSEIVLGNYLKSTKRKFKVVSKLPPVTSVDQVSKMFDNSLLRLQQHKLYGYLVHNFATFLQLPDIWQAIEELKTQGKITKIGFSLYNPQELEELWDKNITFDLVQFPLNVFDQRFVPYLSELAKRGVEVHTRSAFLQGLVFLQPEKLSSDFNAVKKPLAKLRSLATIHNTSISAVCMSFVLSHTSISKLVMGVESKINLIDNLADLKNIKKLASIQTNLQDLHVDDLNIINPSLWRKSD